MAFELLEELLGILAHDVDQHVEATTVRHTKDHAVHTVVSGGTQNLIDDWNHRLSAFETETLCTDILCCEELFERFCSVQTLKDAKFLVKRRRERDPFHLRLQPTLLFCVLDVHVLNTNGAAVRIAKNSEKFIKLHLAATSNAAGEKLALEVPDGEAVMLRVKIARKLWLFPTQWVDVCNEVTTNAM